MTHTTNKTDGSSDTVIALVTKIEDTNGANTANVANGLVQVMMQGARFPGFWSGEIIPPSDSHQNTWKLVQRFDSFDQAEAWQTAPSRADLIRSIQKEDNSTPVEVSDEIAEKLSYAEVATAISTTVKPEKRDAFLSWEAKIQGAQAQFPGYRGTYLQPPARGIKDVWSTLVRFDTPESFERWFTSAERQALVNEAAELINATQFRSVSNSFPGWFPVDSTTGKGPPNWKTSAIVLANLFPVVMLEIRFLSPYMKDLNPDLSTFINLVLTIIITTWGTMPVLIGLFKWWLFPDPENEFKTNIKGFFAVMALLSAEIAVFWNLLPRS
jgi:antibiotic biosynthesis monooxygenase (ABM) superfamily enzyme